MFLNYWFYYFDEYQNEENEKAMSRGDRKF